MRNRLDLTEPEKFLKCGIMSNLAETMEKLEKKNFFFLGKVNPALDKITWMKLVPAEL